MTRARGHRVLAAGLCIAIVAVAAVLPGTVALDYALFELAWVLLPDLTFQVPETLSGGACVPASPLLQVLSSRAPPSTPVA